MAVSCMALPIGAMMMLNTVGIKPASKGPKFGMDIITLAFGLYFGFPISVATFPALSIKRGKDIEPEFHTHDLIYFNRGK